MRDLTYDPRQVGQVVRYHTWAVNHKQSIGEHSWQILRILLTVWPAAPRRVMIYTVVHDMGEMAGDISYPFKKLFPDLKNGSRAADVHVMKEMGKFIGVPAHSPLSPFEAAVFKLCEYIEMWEYGLNEVNMGNTYGATIVDRMIKEIGPSIYNLENKLHETQDAKQHPDVLASIHKYIQTRMNKENDDG